MIARSVFSQGQLAVALGELAEARAHFQECIGRFTESQDKHHANLVRTELAHLERRQGDYTEALELYKAAILVWQDLGLQAAIARQFECLVMIAAARNHLHYAARLSGAAMKWRKRTEPQFASGEHLEYDKSLGQLRVQMEE